MESAFKLVQITDKPWEQRWDALKEILKTDLNLDFSSEIKTATSENFVQLLKEVLASDVHFLRVDPRFQEHVAENLSQTTVEVVRAGCCNFLMKDKKGWWPKHLLDEGFGRVLAQEVGKLDLNSYALIVGTGAQAKMISAALIRLGYETVHFVSASREAGHAMVGDMKKLFFQVDFKHIPFQTITTLPGVYSILVNTESLTLENTLLDDLYFFNFLKAGGVVIDLNLIPSTTPLIAEAKEWGTRHMSGDYIVAEVDAMMVELGLKKKIDISKYRTELRKKADAVPFDISPILNRFRGRNS